jgi:hypothetical protein
MGGSNLINDFDGLMFTSSSQNNNNNNNGGGLLGNLNFTSAPSDPFSNQQQQQQQPKALERSDSFEQGVGSLVNLDDLTGARKMHEEENHRRRGSGSKPTLSQMQGNPNGMFNSPYSNRGFGYQQTNDPFSGFSSVPPPMQGSPTSMPSPRSMMSNNNNNGQLQGHASRPNNELNDIDPFSSFK